MANFCKYCGKQLSENGVCDCGGANAYQQQQQPPMQGYAQPASAPGFDFGAYFNNILGAYKNPGAYMAKMKGADLTTNFLNIGLHAFFVTLFATIWLAQGYNFGEAFGKGLLVALGAVVMDLIIAGTVFVIASVVKHGVTFNQALSVSAVGCVPKYIGYILCGIFALFDPSAATITIIGLLLIATLALSLLFKLPFLRQTLNLSGSSEVYAGFAIVAVAVLVFFLMAKLYGDITTAFVLFIPSYFSELSNLLF